MESESIIVHADFEPGQAKRVVDLPVDESLVPQWAKVVLIDSVGGLNVQIVGIAEFDLRCTSVEAIVAEVQCHKIDWKPPKFCSMLTAITLCPKADCDGAALDTVYMFVLAKGLDARYSTNLPAIQAAGPKAAARLANSVAYVGGERLPANQAAPVGSCPLIATCVARAAPAGEPRQYYSFNLNLEVETVLNGGLKVITPIIIDPGSTYPAEPEGGAGEGP